MRILLADDHTITREGTRRLLEAEADLDVIAEAADGQETVRLARTLCPDIILLDISMPILNGLDVVRIVQATQPKIKIVVLTGYDTEQYVRGLLKLGVQGYLSKSASCREIISALRTVAAGGTCIRRQGHPPSPETIASSAEPTSRELEVLSLVAQGYSNRDIATALSVSTRTVKFHLGNLFGKLDAASRTEVLFKARQQGLIA